MGTAARHSALRQAPRSAFGAAQCEGRIPARFRSRGRYMKGPCWLAHLEGPALPCPPCPISFVIGVQPVDKRALMSHCDVIALPLLACGDSPRLVADIKSRNDEWVRARRRGAARAARGGAAGTLRTAQAQHRKVLSKGKYSLPAPYPKRLTTSSQHF